MFVLKGIVSLGGQFLSGLEGGAVITHTPPTPKFFTFQLLIEDENRFGGHSIECLYPRGVACSSDHFPVEYWSFLEASS